MFRGRPCDRTFVRSDPSTTLPEIPRAAIAKRSAEGTIPRPESPIRFRDGGSADRCFTLQVTDSRGVEPHVADLGNAVSLAGSGGPGPALLSRDIEGRAGDSNLRFRIESARCFHYTNAPKKRPIHSDRPVQLRYHCCSITSYTVRNLLERSAGPLLSENDELYS